MTDVLDSARRLLSTTAGRWESLVEIAPAELLQRPPAPGEWSAADCLDHLLLTERVVFGARLRAISKGATSSTSTRRSGAVPTRSVCRERSRWHWRSSVAKTWPC